MERIRAAVGERCGSSGGMASASANRWLPGDYEIVRELGLPDRPRDERIDRGLVRPQRQQGVGAHADQNQDQEGRRGRNKP